MLHKFQPPHGPEVVIATERVDVNGSKALIIAAGVLGEVNAERILEIALNQQDIASADGVTIFWSTPDFASVTGKSLLRRLFTDQSTLEWGPDLALVDAPQVHAAAERCNAEVEANGG